MKHLLTLLLGCSLGSLSAMEKYEDDLGNPGASKSDVIDDHYKSIPPIVKKIQNNSANQLETHNEFKVKATPSIPYSSIKAEKNPINRSLEQLLNMVSSGNKTYTEVFQKIIYKNCETIPQNGRVWNFFKNNLLDKKDWAIETLELLAISDSPVKRNRAAELILGVYELQYNLQPKISIKFDLAQSEFFNLYDQKKLRKEMKLKADRFFDKKLGWAEDLLRELVEIDNMCAQDTAALIVFKDFERNYQDTSSNVSSSLLFQTLDLSEFNDHFNPELGARVIFWGMDKECKAMKSGLKAPNLWVSKIFFHTLMRANTENMDLFDSTIRAASSVLTHSIVHEREWGAAIFEKFKTSNRVNEIEVFVRTALNLLIGHVKQDKKLLTESYLEPASDKVVEQFRYKDIDKLKQTFSPEFIDSIPNQAIESMYGYHLEDFIKDHDIDKELQTIFRLLNEREKKLEK